MREAQNRPCLLMSTAVGTVSRVLVHHALAVFASDLCDLLWRHLHLLRHSIPWHGLTVARVHRLSIRRVRIVSWIVARRTISLLNWVASGHVSGHLLRHTSGRDKGDLCAACKVGTPLDFYDGLETILDRGSSSSCAAGRHSNAKRKSLSRTLAEIGRSSHLDISGEQNVFGTVHFLNSLTVGKRYPNGFLVGLEHSCFNLDSFALNVFVSFNIDLTHYSLSFRKGCFVESYPDFTLWRDQMIEQTQRLPFPTES